VTHPRIYVPPTPLADAIDQVEAWLEAPGLILLAETEDYWPELRGALEGGRILGSQVHDARIAALCRLHGVRELWTADRDFSRSRASACATRSWPESVPSERRARVRTSPTGHGLRARWR
jgi:predicted nucleic acid-binding protein